MTITQILQPQPISYLGKPWTNPQMVDFNLVGDGSTYAGGFGSNELNNQYGITPSFASSKIESAAASALQKGGSRRKKNKSVSLNNSGVSVQAFSKNIKNKMKIISNKYKNMKGKKSLSLKKIKKSLSLKKIKNKFKSLFRTMSKNLKFKSGKNSKTSKNRKAKSSKAKSSKAKSRSRGRVQKGGYHQYMGNVPATPGYSVAGTTLGANNLGLANPAPITRYVNGIDNYNHYTNKGFQLWN